MSETPEDELLAVGPDPLVGQVVQDRYRIEKRLGQGGMGAVYRAEHLLIGKQVAIKCLHAGLASDPSVVRRFHNEARAATLIGHPNIVDVTDMGRFPDGTFFMVLEFLEGRDWQDDMDATGAQPLGRVAHIALQICDALEAARKKGIVHRDLKPENVFLIERQGDPDFVKVLDFGISKIQSDAGGGTKTGTLMGTPYYMSPEQARGDKEITHLADVYALGVMLYQGLSGRLPLDAEALHTLIVKVVAEVPPPLDDVVGGLPAPVVDLVGRMLEKAPHGRPQTFAEVADVLRPFEHASLRPAVRLSAAPMTAVAGTPRETEQVDTFAKTAAPLAVGAGHTTVGPGVNRPTGPEREPAGQVSAGQGSAERGSTSAAVSLPATSPGRSSRKLGMIAAAAGLAVAVGAAVVARGGDTTATAPEASASANAPASDTPADAGTTVRVQISTLPPDADLFLDGEPISNPFDGEFDRSATKRKLEVRREGFAAQERLLVLTAPQRVFVQLSPKTSEAEEPEAPVRPAVHQAARQAVRPRPVPPSEPQAPPATIAPSTPVPPPAPKAPPKEPAPPNTTSPLKKVF